MRKVWWSVLLVAAVVGLTTVLFSTGGRRAPVMASDRTTARPLPRATAVAGSTDPVRPVPGRPVRIRVEVDSTAPTADISFDVRRVGTESTPTELAGHALPWAAELDAPDGVDNLTIDGYSALRGTVPQVRCRILVGDVVVETRQGATYAHCTFALRDLGG